MFFDKYSDMLSVQIVFYVLFSVKMSVFFCQMIWHEIRYTKDANIKNSY
jgi:hypothetical protein